MSAPNDFSNFTSLSFLGMVKANQKDYVLSVDYCAFMVAIMIARHTVNNFNLRIQWSAEELSENLNSLTHTQSANFFVHPHALKHGLTIFQKQINKRGMLAIPDATLSKAVPEFFDQNSILRSVEVRFVGYYEAPENESEKVLLDRIKGIRDDLLCKNNYHPSTHSTPASAFGDLYLPTVKKNLYQNQPRTKIAPLGIKPRIARKSPTKLQRRALKINAQTLVSSAVRDFGPKHALHYLESAVKEESNRKRKLDANSEEVNNYDDNGIEERYDDISLVDITDDDRVVEAVSDIPDKYINFGEEDVKIVLAVFDAVKVVVVEREYKYIRTQSARITCEIMHSIPYYSQISSRTILRWNDVRDRNKEKPGRKISEKFESEVWGNLMLRVFQKKNDEVRNTTIN